MLRARELEAPSEVSAGKAAWVAALIGLAATWAAVAAPAWVAARCGGETIAPAEAPPCDAPPLFAKAEAGGKGSASPLVGPVVVSPAPVAERAQQAAVAPRLGWQPRAPLTTHALLDVAPKTSPPRARELA